MKRIVVIAILLALAIYAMAKDVGLEWDDAAQPPHDPANTFILYHATDSSGPYLPLLNIPGTKTNATLDLQPGQHYFFLTQSNSFWGETSRSNITNTPPAPAPPGNLIIKLVQ